MLKIHDFCLFFPLVFFDIKFFFAQVNTIYRQNQLSKSAFPKKHHFAFVHFSHFVNAFFYILTFCTKPIFFSLNNAIL